MAPKNKGGQQAMQWGQQWGQHYILPLPSELEAENVHHDDGLMKRLKM